MVLFVLLFCSLVVSVDAALMWSQTYGGTGYETAYSLVATSDGGYALAGETSSFGAEKGDFWLVKTDAFGNKEWNQTYGGTGSDEAYSLVATSDGGYALAGTWNHTDSPYGDEFWLIKTGAFGNMLWNTTYGATWGIERAYALVATADDGYAIEGYTTSFGGGSSDFWLIKTNASGQVAWNQTYGGLGSQNAYSVIQTSDGGYALTGYIDSGAAGYDFWLVKTDEFGVVPEYSSWLIPALVLTATAFILINKQRLR